MKICFITTFFTGATLPLLKHLTEQGHQTDLYLLSRQGQTEIETITYDHPVRGNTIMPLSKSNDIYRYLDATTNIYVTPYHIVRNRRYLIGFWPWLLNRHIFNKLLLQIEKRQYDFIYIIVNEEHDALICNMLKQRGYENVAVAYHEVVESHTDDKCLKQSVQNTISLGYPVLTYSEHTQRQLSSLTGKKDIHVIYFGPFETFLLFDTDKPLITDPYVLFIGSIQPYKGLPFLYDTVCKELDNPSCKIVVAGSGKDPVLAEMEKDERFHVINRRLTDAEFANLTRYARCVVCPYKSGSQSGITHVAMAFGTPVVATRVAAFEEFIDEGENGWLVNYGDTRALAEKMNTIGSKSKQGAKSYVPQKMQWETIIQLLSKEILSAHIQ